MERDPRFTRATVPEKAATRAAASRATVCATSLARRLSGYAYPEVSRAMVNNFAARKAVEKKQGGKVKNRLPHLAWKSRQTPARFPLSPSFGCFCIHDEQLSN